MRYSKIKTLIINSYAGSLVIAARALGVKIIGSYETSGYGIDIQRLNFRGIRWIESQEDWPKQNLRDVIVMAHPPCSPFCNQGAGARDKKRLRGVGADAFKPTIDLFKYALGQGCRALLSESVVGAYKGAEDVHKEHARANGYNLYRVVQNSITFGVPQFRPRFWLVFVRRDAIDGRTFVLRHKPKFVTLAQALDALDDPGVPFRAMMKEITRERRVLRAKGFTPRQIKWLYARPGHLSRRLPEEFPERVGELRGLDLLKEFLESTWGSSITNVLDPDGYAGTLVSGYCWMYRGRAIGDRQAKVIMGFPPDYDFGSHQQEAMTYLSRGVVPHVARWLLDEIIKNLEGVARDAPEEGERTYELEDGDVADVRVRRQTLAFVEPPPSKIKQLRLFE